MDIALIHVPVEDVVEDEPSFNPYFNGYCSYTILAWVNIMYMQRVSILILMDIALILYTLSFSDFDEILFQSLF